MKIRVKKEYVFMFFIASLISFVSLRMGQDLNGDVFNYHEYNAYSFLKDRFLKDISPAGAHTFFNPYLDVFNYLINNHINNILAPLILGLIDGLVVVPLFFICNFFIENKKISFLLTFICSISSPMFLAQVGESMHDNFIAILQLCSFYLILIYIRRCNIKYLALSSIICGVSFGLKMTSAAVIPALFLLVVIYSKRKIIPIAVFSLFNLLGFLISDGLWAYKLYKYYKNPFFPFVNNVFKSPYALTDSHATRDMYFFNFHGLEKILYPFYFSDNFYRVASAGNAHSVVNYNALLCFFVLIMYYISQLSSENKILKKDFNILSIFYIVFFYTWQYTFGVYRYFMACEVLSPLVIFVFSKNIIFNILGKKMSSIISIFFVMFVVTINYSKGMPDWGRGVYTYPYIKADYPETIKEADVLFLGSWFSAWVIPAINPQGSVVSVDKGVLEFRNENYIKRYFSINRRRNMYILFSDLHIDRLDMEKQFSKKFLENNYKLKIDFDSCGSFKERISSISSNVIYCKVEESKNL